MVSPTLPSTMKSDTFLGVSKSLFVLIQGQPVAEKPTVQSVMKYFIVAVICFVFTFRYFTDSCYVKVN